MMGVQKMPMTAPVSLPPIIVHRLSIVPRFALILPYRRFAMLQRDDFLWVREIYEVLPRSSSSAYVRLRYGRAQKWSEIAWPRAIVRPSPGRHAADPILPTQRGGYGNSKVLSPEFRDPRRAYQVGRWLVEKATARLRRDGRVAARFSLTVSFLAGQTWARGVSCFPTQDTAFFLRLHCALWRALWRNGRPGPVISLGVNLTEVDLLDHRQGDLLAPLAPAERTRGEQVSLAVDQINARFGDGMIRYGINAAHPGFFERG